MASTKIDIVLFTTDVKLKEKFGHSVGYHSTHKGMRSISDLDELKNIIRSKERHILLFDISSFEWIRKQVNGSKPKHYPHVSCMLISSSNDALNVGKVLYDGIAGIVDRDQLENGCTAAISSICSGSVYLDQIFIRKLEASRKVDELNGIHDNPLSEREMEVLCLILEEKSNTAIAQELYISSHTVNSHRKNIFRKLKVKSIVGLIQKLNKSSIQIHK